MTKINFKRYQGPKTAQKPCHFTSSEKKACQKNENVFFWFLKFLFCASSFFFTFQAKNMTRSWIFLSFCQIIEYIVSSLHYLHFSLVLAYKRNYFNSLMNDRIPFGERPIIRTTLVLILGTLCLRDLLVKSVLQYCFSCRLLSGGYRLDGGGNLF